MYKDIKISSTEVLGSEECVALIEFLEEHSTVQAVVAEDSRAIIFRNEVRPAPRHMEQEYLGANS